MAEPETAVAAKKPLDPGAEMPFMDHLQVLRKHLTRAAIWFAIACAIAFFFVDWAWLQLMAPLCQVRPDDCHVYPRDLMESFWVFLKLGALLAFFLSLPALFMEAWGFVAPGLYEHEKKLVVPFSLAVGVLFSAGAVFGFFVVLPPAFRFFLGMESTWNYHYLISMAKYFSFCATMLIAFGVVFELPLLMMLLCLTGLVTPRWFARYRRVMWLVMLVFSAVATPTTDPVTMMLMGGPMIVLYEVGLILGRMVYRKRTPPEDPSAPATSDLAVESVPPTTTTPTTG